MRTSILYLVLASLAAANASKPARLDKLDAIPREAYSSLFERYVATHLRQASGEMLTLSADQSPNHLSLVSSGARSSRTRSRAAKAALRHSYLESRPRRRQRSLKSATTSSKQRQQRRLKRRGPKGAPAREKNDQKAAAIAAGVRPKLAKRDDVTRQASRLAKRGEQKVSARASEIMDEVVAKRDADWAWADEAAEDEELFEGVDDDDEPVASGDKELDDDSSEQSILADVDEDALPEPEATTRSHNVRRSFATPAEDSPARRMERRMRLAGGAFI